MRIRKKSAVVVLLVLAFLAVKILAHRISVRKHERESHFVEIFYMAMMATANSKENNVPPPQTIRKLLEQETGGTGDILLRPFEDGLDFQTVAGGFDLSEPTPRMVSFFQHDRLIASEGEWPHWEGSGEKAWKIRGQEIPPNFLRPDSRKPTSSPDR